MLEVFALVACFTAANGEVFLSTCQIVDRYSTREQCEVIKKTRIVSSSQTYGCWRKGVAAWEKL